MGRSVTNMRLLVLDKDRDWLQQIYPQYLKELQSLGSHYKLDEHGVWQPDLLPYWFDPNQPVELWLLRESDQNCGFCFLGIDSFAYKSPQVDIQISEFYLLPAYRRRRLAQQMADQIIKTKHGLWELEVLNSNHAALAFWRKTLAAYTDYREYERECDVLIQFRS